MEKLTPFGINYSGNTCSIKLRFHPNKWNKAPIETGNYKFTKNGYVLFECNLNTKTDEYQYVMNQISRINTP
jgi:hypothetical protein